MFLSDIEHIEKKQIEGNGANNVEKQVLVGPDQGWPGHVLRRFVLGSEGYSSRHSHPWYHVIYVLEGSGTLFMDGKEYPISAGSTAFVPADTLHQLSNATQKPMAFLCIVPDYGDK